MRSKRTVNVSQRQFRKLLTHVRRKILNLVVATVQRVTKLGVLRGGQDVDEFHQELARRFKIVRGHSIPHQLVIFVKCCTQSEVTVLRLDRANPDLENLLLAAQVRIGLELKHATWKIFYVGVVAVIQSPQFTQTLIEIRAARTMLAQV